MLALWCLTAAPQRGELTITADVLDPKLQGHVIMLVCGPPFSLRLTGALADYRVQYACADRPKSLEFMGMRPLSPRELRLSNDSRALSLALAAIRVASDVR